MWNERYSQPGFAYGIEPNDFLREMAPRLPAGGVLSLGEGEGRNAVFLAQSGSRVTALDQSSIGLEKAARFAAERGVAIETVAANLAEYRIAPSAWDAIISIWCHLPRPLRRTVHANVVSGLRSGGAFLLEAYTPRQLQLGTGGPRDPEFLATLVELKAELAGLDFAVGRELEREVHEGAHHNGKSAVVQLLAFKR